jgi:hypothetical protein
MPVPSPELSQQLLRDTQRVEAGQLSGESVRRGAVEIFLNSAEGLESMLVDSLEQLLDPVLPKGGEIGTGDGGGFGSLVC